jgi:hypothetical protein
MAQTTKRPHVEQVTYVLTHTRAPNLLRVYHQNITQNHRVRKAAKIGVASIVTRAQRIVDQQEFVPMVIQKVDE